MAADILLQITLSGRFGSLEIAGDGKQSRLMVTARGYIGPHLIRRELAIAHEFGLARPDGWDYIVDTSGLLWANPLNLFYLRRIPALPNLHNYIVVAPKRWVRLLVALASPLVRPTEILAARKPSWQRPDRTGETGSD